MLVIIKEVTRFVEGRHKSDFKKLIKPKSCEDTRNSTDMTVLKIILPYWILQLEVIRPIIHL